jgi:cell division protein FtsQ
MAVASRPPRSGPVKRATGAAGGKAAGAKGTPVKGTAKGAAAKKAPAKGTPAKAGPARAGQARGQARGAGGRGAGPVRGFAHGPAGRPPRGNVSPTSAQRVAARVRARRRRRVLIVLAVLIVLGALAWAVLKSPWATVRKIEVTGTDRISSAAVRAQAEAELGHPMLLARTGDIADRVRRERLVRSVRVQRQWPSTIRVQVVERVPVAALPAGSALSLVDLDGVEIEQVKVSPAGLPRLEVARGPDGVPALRGCLDVLRALPPAVSRRLLAIGAESPNGIWLKLRDPKVANGARVEWGDSGQTPRKARVLTALLSKHAVLYDVRSPDTPAIRGN